MLHTKYVLLLPALCLSLSAAAVSPQHDEYYSDDIFTAIEEAKHRTHHYNYSRSKRYNRSTSQSIQIPRLLNTEMDEQVIKGAIAATASGDERTNEIPESQRQTDLNSGNTETIEKTNQLVTLEGKQSTTSTSRNKVYIREIQYNGQDFVGTARNVRTEASVTATVRP